MGNLFDIVLCATHLVSTVAILKLFVYTIVRYHTSERGEFDTGFTLAGLVLVILGMLLNCILASTWILMVVIFGDQQSSANYLYVMKFAENIAYLFSLCWLNAICIFTTNKTLSMTPPLRPRIQDHGFCYSKLWKWIPYTVVVPLLYGAITVAMSFFGGNISIRIGKDFKHLYISITYYAISGICNIVNIVSLAILGRYLKKSSVLTEVDQGSIWKRIPRALKSSIKCSIIISSLWLCDLMSWLSILWFQTLHPSLLDLSLVFKLIYSLQGLLLYLIVFFYRSKQDENPVMKSISKLFVGDKERNQGFNAADNQLNN